MDNDCHGLVHVDLNLMLVFWVLFHSPSVSSAAKRLGVGQPAVSNSLKKLRTLFNDPLFQRGGNGIRPTAKAVHIATELGPAIHRIQSVIP
ncbi:HTH-type transcriptional regulator LeuO [Pseudomonas fluorescens]|jgi:DNA-binding transcriptional LysR family regulator|nr:HTH-type transcriptional regulator LeuO [Pseudomonas fluorescens]